MLSEMLWLCMAIGTGFCVVGAWRLGLRDGMRTAKQQEPAPMLPARRADPAAEENDVELQETLENIDRFDGWRR